MRNNNVTIAKEIAIILVVMVHSENPDLILRYIAYFILGVAILVTGTYIER